MTRRLPARRHPRPARADQEWTVEVSAAWWLRDGGAVPEALAELDARIDAHGESRGCCGNGCNTNGWLEPFPCTTRRFYLALREHLSPVPRSSQALEVTHEPRP